MRLSDVMTGLTKGNDAILTNVINVDGDTIDVSTGGLFKKTVTEAVQFKTVKKTPTPVATFSLFLTNGGSNVTWGDNFHWAEGEAPSLSDSGLDILTFLTNDYGVNWYGIVSLSNAQ